jgi:hypothetical protein
LFSGNAFLEKLWTYLIYFTSVVVLVVQIYLTRISRFIEALNKAAVEYILDLDLLTSSPRMVIGVSAKHVSASTGKPLTFRIRACVTLLPP